MQEAERKKLRTLHEDNEAERKRLKTLDEELKAG
jgi:hypothetical protein